MSSGNSFSFLLKQLRKNRGLTQAALARQASCAIITIQKMEAGSLRPSQQMACRLAAALELEPNQETQFLALTHGQVNHDLLPPGNLPAPTTRLIGREQDVSQASKCLLNAHTRLLTLVGPPGIGKTRLALEVAGAVHISFADGVYFVALASLTDPKFVLPTIGRALHIQDAGDRPWLERLADYLQHRQMLIVLDNFEQVTPAAPLIARLIKACPQIKIMSTSRIRLHVKAERLYIVPALALPDPNSSQIHDLQANPAVSLFIDRAQAINAKFTITAYNAKTIAQLCRHMDGLPLAIELLAARIRVMSPSTMLKRLNEGWWMRSEGWGDMEMRHHTLKEAIAWSYDLLQPAEQGLFKQLGVFVDGWTTDALVQVCGDDAMPATSHRALIDSLVRQNLVTRAPQPENARCGMLEAIREYAREQLGDDPEASATQRRHAAYFLGQLQMAAPHFTRLEGQHWLDKMIPELGNVRAALAWADQSGEGEMLAQMALAYNKMAWMCNLLDEARDWLLQAIASISKGVSPNTQVHLCSALGINEYLHGNYLASVSHLEKALDLAHAINALQGAAWAQFNLALALKNAGDFERAEKLWLDVVPRAQECGSKFIEGLTYGNLSEFERERGHVPQAIALCESGIALLQDAGDSLFTTMLLNNLGAMMRAQGRLEEAYAIHMRCLRILQTNGNSRETAFTLEKLAGIATAQDDPLRGARLLGAASAIRQQIHMPAEASYGVDYGNILLNTKEKLDIGAFNQAWVEGSMMPLDQVVDFAYFGTSA